MCSVSDKIILCTCEIDDVSSLKHYWALFRYNPDEGVFLVGEPIGFEQFLQLKDPHNPVLLCNKLNEAKLFDKPLTFNEKDRLLISIHFSGNEDPTNYGFEFKKGNWKVIDFEYFDWRAEHKEFFEGKIKNETSRMKKQ